MKVKELNKEVFYAKEKIIKIKRQDIALLKEKALSNQRKRIRLCMHENVDDVTHEMFIVHTKDMYVRPHKHLKKSESFNIVEGKADIVLFDEKGRIIEIISVGDYASGNNFYYRINDPYYHTLFIRSEIIVFHETTKGPFNKSDTVFASWAPEEGKKIAQKKFMKKLSQEIKRFTSLNK